VKDTATITCIVCKKPKSFDEMGVNPHKPGGHDQRCKVCINEYEGVKRGLRINRLAELKDDVHTWPEEKLLAECDWLLDRLQVLTEEVTRREVE